jgi:small-conductance mechanosensitive channel
MGPGGALIGALIAVGAALGTTFLSSTQVASEGLEDLDEKIKDLLETTDIVSDVYDNYMRLLKNSVTDEQADAVASYKAELAELEQKLLDNINAQAAIDKLNGKGIQTNRIQSGTTADLTDLIKKQMLEIAKLEAAIKLYTGEVDGSNDAAKEAKKLEEILLETRNESADALADFAKAEDKRIKALDKEKKKAYANEKKLRKQNLSEFLDAVAKENEALDDKKNRRKQALAEINASIDAEVEAERKKNEAIRAVEYSMGDPIQRVVMEGAAKIEALKKVHSLEEQATKEFSDRIIAINKFTTSAVRQAQLEVMNQTVGMFASQANQLSSFFDQASSIGKAFYLVSQTMAAAQAIISGYAASMNIVANMTALGADPATAAMLGQIAVGMGYATAGAIMGQTIAGFEGGGITFNGVRSGGMDGRGGRMAVVHPNEKITDMEKGGGGGSAPINVTMNISAVDAKGIDKLLIERRGLITGMVNKAINNQGRSSI